VRRHPPSICPDHAHPARGRIVGHFFGETRLADARLATQQEQATVTGAHFVQTGAELGQLPLSADKPVI
jgi:hypothetical protein